MAEFHQVRVAEVIEETAEARSLVLDAPSGFDFLPGQFITVRVGAVARCYSMSSAPHEGLKITVKRMGSGSAWLCDEATEGTVLDVLPPAGVFTPRSLDEDLLLFAAGSGITPVMSIVKSVLAGGTGRIVLVYANRDERSVIFADELRGLAADRLVVVHWLESVQGLPTVPHLLELARPFADRVAFVCGPAPFMQAATTALRQLDLPRDRIHVEKFVSLSGNPFAVAAPLPGEDRPSTTVDVELDGTRHRLDWPAQTRLLDLLLDNGIDAPYSCREGACSACTCRLVRGEVKMLNNDVLDEQDLADGYVLACQAVPVTDTVEITYS
jgi:3-ketosteroid 9alpha-monooxygenase subunit B